AGSASPALQTVVVRLAALLPVLGSPTALATVAPSTRAPVAVASATMVTVTSAWLGTVPRPQVTVEPAAEHAPWLDAADRNVAEAPRVSVRTVAGAASGPASCTRMV